MTEMQQAFGMLKGIKDTFLIQFPSGRYGFTGHVPVALAYTDKASNVPTDEQASDARSFGPGIVGLKTKAWDTREEAIEAAKAIGVNPKFSH